MRIVNSRANPEFKALRRLAEDAREVRQTGKTLIDGPHLVAAYHESGGIPEKLIVSESGMTVAEVQDLLANYSTIEVVQLRDALFAEISGVVHPVGILAIIDVPRFDALPAPGPCVLLDNVQDAGNVGTILRTAAAAGVADIYLGSGCAGAWLPRVLRAGQGAHFHLRIRENADLSQVIDATPGPVVATVARDAQSIYDLDLSGPVAWLFGNEGSGVSPELIARADLKATIPLVKGSESLNVSAAAAVCLFEALRQRHFRT